MPFECRRHRCPSRRRKAGQKQGRIPARVEAEGVFEIELAGDGGDAGRLEMGIERLAGDEQAQNLAGPFANQVEAGIAQHPLHRHRRLATSAQAVSRLVAAAAAHLQGGIKSMPGGLGTEELGRRRLQTYVHFPAIGKSGTQPGEAVDGEAVGGDARDFGRHRLVLPDRRTPLASLVPPAAADR